MLLVWLATVSCVSETQLIAQQVHLLGHMWTGNMENHALGQFLRGREVWGVISPSPIASIKVHPTGRQLLHYFIWLLWQLIRELDPTPHSVAFHPSTEVT